MSPEVRWVIGVCGLLLLWYVAGHFYNRRRGRRLYAWLAEGLERIGGARQGRWIGSPASGAQVYVADAAPPFQEVTCAFLLENRESPLLWLLDRLRGRRDRLTLQATLRRPRRGEVDIRPAGSAPPGGDAWLQQPGPHGLRLFYRGPGGQRQIAALQPWLEHYGASLKRLLWSRQSPHLQIQVHADRLFSISAPSFIADLQQGLGSGEDAGPPTGESPEPGVRLPENGLGADRPLLQEKDPVQSPG